MEWCQWIHILVFFRFTFLYFIICHPITDPSIYLIKSPPLYLEDMGKQVTFAENNLFKTSLYYLRKLTFGKPMIGCAVNIVLWSVLVHIWIVGHKFNKYVFFLTMLISKWSTYRGSPLRLQSLLHKTCKLSRVKLASLTAQQLFHHMKAKGRRL